VIMKRSIIIVTVLLLLAAAAYGARQLFGEGGESEYKGVLVRRGALDITVLETGNLKAAKSVSYRSEIEGRATILYLIEEGTLVEPGTLLVRLDASGLDDERVNQEIAVRNAQSARVKAEQELEIQKSQNTSDISVAERTLTFAIQDLEKYKEGDWPQQLKQASDDILLRQEELKRAEDTLEWSQQLFDDGFLTRTELEADQLAAQRATIQLEQAERAKELLEAYDYPREVASLEADVEEAERDLERVKLQAAARLVDYETDLQSKIRKLELEEEKYAKIEEQIANAEIVSDVSGMVVYYKEQSRWGRNEDPIQEGTEVRERQELITIPSSDGMIIEASVHESVLEQVQVGQDVRITVDALPEREFKGRVRFKAVLPDQNSWWANPDLRVYRTEIEVVDPDPAMRPGMTCAVRVQVAHLPDVLHVPVQARFFRGEQAVVFVVEDDQIAVREVELGMFNESWIEVRSGLEEGEEVLLSVPTGFDVSDVPPPTMEEGEGGGEGVPRGGPDAGSRASRGPGGGERRMPEGFDPSKFDPSKFDASKLAGRAPGASGGKGEDAPLVTRDGEDAALVTSDAAPSAADATPSGTATPGGDSSTGGDGSVVGGGPAQ